MILSKEIEVKVSNNQIKYWKDKGYETSGNNEKLLVKVSDLPNNSGQKIKVKCEICGKEKEITKNRYIVNTKNNKTYYSCSRKCSNEKTKSTCINTYGVDNISKLDIIKMKKEETTLKNFDVRYPMQNEQIRQKSCITKLIKYNNKNYNNQEKRRKTSIDKYGVDIPSKSIEVKEKLSQSNRIAYENMLNLIKREEYKYIENDSDYINSHSIIKITCSKHGDFYQKCYKYRQGQGCPKCNQSKGEKEIEMVLKMKNIKYQYQKKFDNCKNKRSLPFDFYLPMMNICIEYDGIQHFESIEFFGGKEALKKLIKNDDIKDKYCRENNIKLIRISYKDDIKTILSIL